MFCKNTYKRTSLSGFQKLTAVMAPSVEEELKNMIRGDEVLWIEYGEIDFVAKEVAYHVKCKQKYNPPSKKQPSTSICSVYAGLYAQITVSVIHNQKLMTTEDVYNWFKECYERTTINAKLDELPAKRTVLAKVYSYFGDTIKTYNTRPYAVIYKAVLSEDDIPILLRNMEADALGVLA